MKRKKEISELNWMWQAVDQWISYKNGWPFLLKKYGMVIYQNMQHGPGPIIHFYKKEKV